MKVGTDMTTETIEAVATDSTTETKIAATKVAGAPKFTMEELEKYREEAISDNIKLRQDKSEYKKQMAQLEEQVRKGAELEEQLSKVQQSARERIAKADFRARLRSEGIDDPDVLKMIDLSSVEYDEDGDLKNADAVWAKFQESKPYLFAGKTAVNTSTSSVHKAPSEKDSSIDWLTAPAELVQAARKPSRFKQ